MPSASSLTEGALAASPSHGGASSMTSGRSWSSSSFVSRPSPYGSERQVRSVHRRSNDDVAQSRSEHYTDFTSLEKEIIASASDDFKAASCLSDLWEAHCEHRVGMANEAAMTANRTASNQGLPTIAITGAIRGKVS